MHAVPRISLIHATPLAIAPIQSAFARHWSQVRLANLLDDSLSQDRARDGRLTDDMVERFVRLAKYAKDSGSQGILFTCSAFGPAIEHAAKVVQIPTLKPNQAMFEQALASPPKGGKLRLGLIATFAASLPSMSEELVQLAAARSQHIELDTALAEGAMEDLAQGKNQLHDEKILRAAQSLQQCDVLMLAQFSMSGAQPLVQANVACPVLTSPDCAVLGLKAAISASS